MLLKISQNSQENTCARVSFFNKVAGLRSATLLKKRLWHKRFPVNFAKLLRAPFFNWTPLDDCFYINVAVTIWYQFLKILHFTISLHSSHSSLYGVLQKQPPEVFFLKKAIWKCSQNSQGNTCVGVSFNKVPGLQLFGPTIVGRHAKNKFGPTTVGRHAKNKLIYFIWAIDLTFK